MSEFFGVEIASVKDRGGVGAEFYSCLFNDARFARRGRKCAIEGLVIERRQQQRC